jgi:hypothetical protein
LLLKGLPIIRIKCGYSEAKGKLTSRSGKVSVSHQIGCRRAEEIRYAP